MKYIQLIAIFCFLAAVHAHIGVSPSITEAGSRVDFDLHISYDCGDDTVGTTNFTVELPMDPPIFSVNAHQVPIWRVFINKEKLDMLSKSENTVLMRHSGASTILGSFPMDST